jgi:hypothetical protein
MAQAQPTDVLINVFWFAAAYESDQKEQDLLCVAIERQRGREVRHLEQLLAADRLVEAPVEDHPPARAMNLLGAFDAARRQALRTITAAAGRRLRELHGRLDRQRRRIEGYYEDLLSEIDEAHARAQRLGHDLEKHAIRRQHAQQERRIRLAEVDRAASLKVRLRLTNLLEVHQPKLQVSTKLSRPGPGAQEVDLALTWDPLLEALEPPDCRVCGRPSFVIRFPMHRRPGPSSSAQPAWTCDSCHNQPPRR